MTPNPRTQDYLATLQATLRLLDSGDYPKASRLLGGALAAWPGSMSDCPIACAYAYGVRTLRGDEQPNPGDVSAVRSAVTAEIDRVELAGRPWHAESAP